MLYLLLKYIYMHTAGGSNMPIRTVITTTPAVSGIFGLNSTQLTGRRWTVQPLLPIPDDITTQAVQFVTSNRNKSANVSVWSNVQYGQDPVGALRFKPCAPYVYPTAGPYDAIVQTPPPYQRYGEELGTDGRFEFGDDDVGAYDWPGMGVKETESCLRLNIFAPEGLSNRPVIFHIHGGGWGVYHSRGPQQLGHRMAAHKGCVVVTVEYRLSTRGHFPHPDLIESNEPSVAYTDIKVALEWVYNNISAFGGDNTKICISGTSAGGAAVQLLMTDDDTQTWFSSAWIGSGGGGANYIDSDYYNDLTRLYEKAIRGMAPILSSKDPAYHRVSDAITANGFAWAMQNALRIEDLEALADAGEYLTYSSVKAAVASGSALATYTAATANIYPFKRGTHDSAIEAAKDGKYRKPFVSLYVECEALTLLADGSTDGLRTALLNLSTDTLDSWSQRLGYIDYDGWKAAAWQPVVSVDYADVGGGAINYTGLGHLSSSWFGRVAHSPNIPSADSLEAENRRVLYTHAVFGYPAWRVARAATETASATAWLIVNNFSPNGVWASHSQEVSLMLGNIEWVVAGKKEFDVIATPDPGWYVANYMDSIYASEFMMQALAALAATGDPDGAYTYLGFDLFDDPATLPSPASYVQPTFQEYEVANPGYANVIGKFFDQYNLNGYDPTLMSWRDARSQYGDQMGAAMLEYESLLEP